MEVLLRSYQKSRALQQYLGWNTQFRHLTNVEVSTALRPFYFSVHPDLFGQYPDQRFTNENSLKHLSSFLELLQSKRHAPPCSVQFYVRGKEDRTGDFKLVKIHLRHGDLHDIVTNILRTCHLSTDYVDNIPKSVPSPPQPKTIDDIRRGRYNQEIDFSKLDEDDPIFGPVLKSMKDSLKEKQDLFKLRNYLKHNHAEALNRYGATRLFREDNDRLRLKIMRDYGLADVKLDCGWNETHIRGCLQSFLALADHYQEEVHSLKGRILVFAPFTGVSLDGHIMLYSGEVRHNWLELIKNVKKYDLVLLRIPAFEKAVCLVLRHIKVGRRKFMPKILAGEYERHLLQITTSLNDYLSSQKYPAEWPETLSDYEIVVETEAGPLMVSPTGQFIVPASCPGSQLVGFITDNMSEALARSIAYETNKHVEKSLEEQCLKELQLESLRKDDNVSPDRMIECLQRLIGQKQELQQLKGICLTIATYYAVVSNGDFCIPWNWEL